MDRVKQIGLICKEFAHENKDLFIVIADPKTDTLFAGYQDSFTYGTIKQPGGMGEGVVKQVLMYSKFNKSLSKYQTFKFHADIFLMNLAEVLWLKIKKAPEFFKFISDALFFLPKGKKYDIKKQEAIDAKEAAERVTLEDVLKPEEVENTK